MAEETIGERIKKLREAKGWSQEDLAHASQMTGSYIGNLERGYERYTNPTLSSISAIANALEVHPTVILYGTNLAEDTSLQGDYVDPNNPLDVTELVKKIEALFPLSKEERELLNNYREINNPKKKKQFLDLSRMFSEK